LSSKADEFRKRIDELKNWKHVEIKTCLIRLAPTDQWKVGFIRLHLLNYGKCETIILLDHDNIRLIREIKKINMLSGFLEQLLNHDEIEIIKEKASLEYFTKQISFAFKDRKSMANNYYIDNACYYLTRSPSSNPTGLADIQNTLRLKLPTHSKPYEDLSQVCELLLGIKFGGAYHPQLQVFAPIFIKIDRFRLEGNNLVICLYCSRKIRLEEFSVSAFGKDINGGLTFSEKFTNFKRPNNRKEIASSSINIAAKDTSFIRLVLSYKKETYPLEEYHRPFVPNLTLNQNKAHIKEKVNQIKSDYLRAKSLSDKNKKGDLFEDVISDLITTVEGLRVTERNIDSGIEEIDLKVLNNNESGIWNQFEMIIFIECKNWLDRVDSKEIRNFEGKMRNYFLHSGIFFAVNGFKNNRRGAIGQIKVRFKQEGFIIIPVDGTDLEEIFRTLDLSRKINEKWIDLIQ
jgi:hypothetical protein